VQGHGGARLFTNPLLFVGHYRLLLHGVDAQPDGVADVARFDHGDGVLAVAERERHG